MGKLKISVYNEVKFSFWGEKACLIHSALSCSVCKLRRPTRLRLRRLWRGVEEAEATPSDPQVKAIYTIFLFHCQIFYASRPVSWALTGTQMMFALGRPKIFGATCLTQHSIHFALNQRVPTIIKKVLTNRASEFSRPPESAARGRTTLPIWMECWVRQVTQPQFNVKSASDKVVCEKLTRIMFSNAVRTN